MKRKYIASILSVALATLMVLLSLNGTVVARTGTMSPFGSTSVASPAINVSAQEIQNLITYLNANPNYSKIEIVSASFVNTTSGTELISSGNLIVNNITYSYSFVITGYNKTKGLSATSTLLMSRTSSSTSETSDADYTYNNVTTLTLKSSYFENLLSKSSSSYGSSIYINSTVKVDFTVVYHCPAGIPPRYCLLPAPGSGTYYVNSSEHFEVSQAVTINSGQKTDLFSFTSPQVVGSGNASMPTSGSNTSITQSMKGTIYNANGTTNNFVYTQINDNASLSVLGDPINLTADPQSQGRSINNGFEYMWMDSVTLNYFDGIGLETLIALIGGLIAAALIAAPIAAAVVGTVAAIAGVMAFYDATFETSQSTDIIYVEAGWWHSYSFWVSWIYEPYIELGYHTNEFHNVVFGGTYYIGWTYVPLFTSTGESASDFWAYMHAGFFPTWNPSI